MKVNFDQTLKDMDGKAIQGDGKDLTLRNTCVNSLLSMFQDEQNLPGEEKLKRFDLATAIYAGTDDLDIKIEDLALIKKLVAKLYGTLVVGQAWKMLEGGAPPTV